MDMMKAKGQGQGPEPPSHPPKGGSLNMSIVPPPWGRLGGGILVSASPRALNVASIICPCSTA